MKWSIKRDKFIKKYSLFLIKIMFKFDYSSKEYDYDNISLVTIPISYETLLKWKRIGDKLNFISSFIEFYLDFIRIYNENTMKWTILTITLQKTNE